MITIQEAVQVKTHINAANEAIKEFNYGDLIGKQWLIDRSLLIEPLRGTKKDFELFAFDFMDFMESFKNEMLETHKMHLVPVRGKGYRIVMPNQQSDEAVNRLRNIVVVETKKAMKTIFNINDALINHEDAKKRDNHIGNVAALKAFATSKSLSY